MIIRGGKSNVTGRNADYFESFFRLGRCESVVNFGVISKLGSVLDAKLHKSPGLLASCHVQVSQGFLFRLVECCHSTSILFECCHFFLLNVVIQLRLRHFVSQGL